MDAGDKISVALVEDDDGTRQAIQLILTRSPAIRLLAVYSRGETAVPCIIQDKPQVVLMDINLLGCSGIECTAKIKQALQSTKVVMLTTYSDSDLIFESLKAGASGYILKRSSGSEIIQAVRDAHTGGAPMSMPIARKLVAYFQGPSAQPQMEADMALTAREHETLSLLAKGLSYKGIAERLEIGVGTVRSHLHKIYSKLHVQSRTQAVLKFLGRQ